MAELTSCPGCGALLPALDGPTHRYIGASPACWAIYTALMVDEPPLAPTPSSPLLVDAYAAQHPGLPSPQSIQSVAVHLLTLYGVLVRGAAPAAALQIRLRAVGAMDGAKGARKHGRYTWLTPPLFAGSLTVAQVAQGPTAQERATLAERYVREVWACWAPRYGATIARWYDEFGSYTRAEVGP